MKRSKLNYYALIVLSVMFISISCNKEKIEKESLAPSDQEVYVKNNIVHFATMDNFKTTVDQLMNYTEDELEKWENSIGFNNSMRKYYQNLEEPDQPELLERWKLIPDAVLATLVNDDGVYVVDGEIHKITYEYEYIIRDGDYSKLTDIENISKNKNANSAIGVFKIQRKTNDSDLKWVGWKTYEKTDICGMTDRRAQLKAWNITTVAYASCGMRIVGRQYIKKCGLCRKKWVDWYMDWAKVDGCARMNYWIGGSTSGVFEHCASDQGTNTKRVDKTLGYAVGIGAVVNCYWIHGTYYYKDAGCSKSWNVEFNG